MSHTFDSNQITLDSIQISPKSSSPRSPPSQARHSQTGGGPTPPPQNPRMGTYAGTYADDTASRWPRARPTEHHPGATRTQTERLLSRSPRTSQDEASGPRGPGPA